MHETDHVTVYEYENEAYVDQGMEEFEDSYDNHTYAINEALRRLIAPRQRPLLQRDVWNKLS